MPALTHDAIEDIAEKWIKEHVKSREGRSIESIEFPKVRFSNSDKAWGITAVIRWKQGFFGRHSKTFHTEPTEVSLEFDFEGNLTGHDLPKGFFFEE